MILFFGPPGSGKSVQGQLLVERNGWQWLSTGDMFRQSQDPEVLKRMATGELIDDKLTSKVLDEAIQSLDHKRQLILDGYPRNLDQAKWLADYLPSRGHKIDCLLLFDVAREELIKRLSGRGRVEDDPQVIGRRLDIYDEKTAPVIDFYRQQNLPVVVVDGMGPVSEVHERVQGAVTPCLKAK